MWPSNADWMISVGEVCRCLEAPMPPVAFARFLHGVVGQKLMVFDCLDFPVFFCGLFLKLLTMDSMLHS